VAPPAVEKFIRFLFVCLLSSESFVKRVRRENPTNNNNGSPRLCESLPQSQREHGSIVELVDACDYRRSMSHSFPTQAREACFFRTHARRRSEAEIRLLHHLCGSRTDVGHNQEKMRAFCTCYNGDAAGNCAHLAALLIRCTQAARLHFSQTPTSSCTPRRLSEHRGKFEMKASIMKDLRTKTNQQQ